MNRWNRFLEGKRDIVEEKTPGKGIDEAKEEPKGEFSETEMKILEEKF